MDALETITEEGITASIYIDEGPMSPREDDNLATYVNAAGRNYSIGDENISLEYNSLAEHIGDNEDDDLIVFVWLDDYGAHGAQLYAVDDVEDANGYFYATRADMAFWQVTEDQARDAINAEIEILNDYLSGNVYGYVVEDAAGNVLDSVWGFIGDLDVPYSARHEAYASLLWEAAKARKKRAEKVKGYIRGRVPLIYREAG